MSRSTIHNLLLSIYFIFEWNITVACYEYNLEFHYKTLNFVLRLELHNFLLRIFWCYNLVHCSPLMAADSSSGPLWPLTLAGVFMWERSAATPGVTGAMSYKASLVTRGFCFSRRAKGWPIPPAAPATTTLKFLCNKHISITRVFKMGLAWVFKFRV